MSAILVYVRTKQNKTKQPNKTFVQVHVHQYASYDAMLVRENNL